MNPTIENIFLKATFNLKGAELISLKSEDREYIWEGNSKFWGKHSPILFPIVGTLKNNVYKYEDKEYSLSRHGFARDLNFTVIAKEASKITFSLKSTNETYLLYPFHFELQISYILEDKKLTVEFVVFNSNNFTMPFSIGGHPALSLPNNFKDYQLSFEDNNELIYFKLKTDLLSNTIKKIELKNNLLDLNYELFDEDALVFKTISSKKIKLIENKKPLLLFSFASFPNFGIWTKSEAPFICLEPWLGYSDTENSSGDIENKEGIYNLPKNETKKLYYSIEIF